MKLFRKFLDRSSANAEASPFVEFAQNCAQEMKRLTGDMVELEMGPTPATTKLGWTTKAGWKTSQFLGHFWAEYRTGVTLDSVLDRLMRSSIVVERATPDVEAGRRSIMPVIKTIDWHRTSLAQLAKAGLDLNDPQNQPFILRRLAGDLVVTYVQDTGDSMSYVGNADCRKLGLDLDELHAIAMNNLERDALPRLEIRGGEGRYAARLDRNYDASMVLLFERWSDQMDLDGDPVIALAARDELLICGSDDEEATTSLRAMAADIASRAPYALSNALFVWREGRIQTL
jgi:uncharacterized protein YtpQ (UPF0354 family)